MSVSSVFQVMVTRRSPIGDVSPSACLRESRYGRSGWDGCVACSLSMKSEYSSFTTGTSMACFCSHVPAATASYRSVATRGRATPSEFARSRYDWGSKGRRSRTWKKSEDASAA